MAFILPAIQKDQQLFVPKNKITARKPKSHSFAAGEHRLAPAPSRRPKSKSMSAAVHTAAVPVTQIEMSVRTGTTVTTAKEPVKQLECEKTQQKVPRRSSISNLWSRLLAPKEPSAIKSHR